MSTKWKTFDYKTRTNLMSTKYNSLRRTLFGVSCPRSAKRLNREVIQLSCPRTGKSLIKKL